MQLHELEWKSSKVVTYEGCYLVRFEEDRPTPHSGGQVLTGSWIWRWENGTYDAWCRALRQDWRRIDALTAQCVLHTIISTLER